MHGCLHTFKEGNSQAEAVAAEGNGDVWIPSISHLKCLWCWRNLMVVTTQH